MPSWLLLDLKHRKTFDSEDSILSIPDAFRHFVNLVCVISFNLKVLEGNMEVTHKELLQFRLAVHFEVLELEAVHDPITCKLGAALRRNC